MKNIILTLFLLIATYGSYSQQFISKFTANELEKAPVKLIPYPQNISWGNQQFKIKNIQVEAKGILDSNNTTELLNLFKDNHILIKKDATQKIVFQKNKNLGKEEYTLNVQPSIISVQAATEKGIFYALQTLRQLITLENTGAFIQSCTVFDKPTYSIRGFMTDTGRNFQSISFLKKIIDVLAKYKFNVFHWHLTDRPAWRIESKKYPQLTAAKNHRKTRDPGKFYAYSQIRELFKYAKAKQIQIIPEIDMPGHSDSFTKAMGYKMESIQGMQALKEILTEFFTEIPKELCPKIHIGSDEVHIKNPDEFIKKMVDICKSNQREVVIWNPGLKADTSVIRQTWKPDYVKGNGYIEIDSWNSYINNGDPFVHISKLFFKPIGYLSKNNVVGGILCLWHDVNVNDEYEMMAQNPLFPSILTYAWTTWTADIKSTTKDYRTKIPLKEDAEYSYFSAFEKYLISHKNKYFKKHPFPYVLQSATSWDLIGAFPSEDVKNKPINSIRKWFRFKKKTKAQGNTIYIKDRFKLGGYFPKAKPKETYFAKTVLFSKKEQDIKVWIGFETPFRANRAYGGIPKKGQWDTRGGCVWLNGVKVPPPIWKNEGWKPVNSNGWGSKKDQEVPWKNEEFYWTRKPTTIHLKKGNNEVIFSVPGTNKYQNWMFTFAILEPEKVKCISTP